MVEYATCAKLFNNPDAAGAARSTRSIPEVPVGPLGPSPTARLYIFDLRKTFRFQDWLDRSPPDFADAFNRDANPILSTPR